MQNFGAIFLVLSVHAIRRTVAQKLVWNAASIVAGELLILAAWLNHFFIVVVVDVIMTVFFVAVVFTIGEAVADEGQLDAFVLLFAVMVLAVAAHVAAVLLVAHIAAVVALVADHLGFDAAPVVTGEPARRALFALAVGLVRVVSGSTIGFKVANVRLGNALFGKLKKIEINKCEHKNHRNCITTLHSY